MTWTLAVIAFAALVRLVYLTARVNHNGTDECHYRQQAEALADRGEGPRFFVGLYQRGSLETWLAPPVRVLYIYAAALAVKLTKHYRWIMLASVSSVAGVLCVGLAAVVGQHLGGYRGATVAAALVSTSPLMLGLGRRVLVDVPASATQLAVLAVATLGPDWWPAVAAALVVMLLTRESARTLAPGLGLAVAWLWGWDLRVLLALGVAAPVYCVVLRLLLGAWPWQFESGFRLRVVRGVRKNPGQYATQQCSGGLHRLVVDLVLVSPLVVLTAQQGGWLSMAALAMLVPYSAPWLDQQIRPCLIVDLLLRIAVAVALPWWAVACMMVVDAYVFWRVWIRGRLYDPTTTGLTKALRMRA